MKVIYQNHYVEVGYHQTQQLFYYVYSPTTITMTPEEYIALQKHLINLIHHHHPKLILRYMMDFQFIITPDIQAWMKENIGKVYEEIGFKKTAILPSKDYISQLSIKQTMGELNQGNFAIQYFDQEEEAMSWLLAA